MHKFLMIGLVYFLSTLTTLFGIEPEDVKKQVERRLQEIVEAINQHKVESFPKFWTEDATLMNPATGEIYKGKSEIADYLQKRDQEIQQRQLNFSFTTNRIFFPAPNQAIVEGVVEIKDKGELLQRNARKIRLVNLNGEWYINEVREVETAPPPPVFSRLKELEWLIGDWKDEDEDVTITFSANWDKFKNFIIQRFKMEIYGLEAMQGIQVIGWDPIEQNIRSWVFDSDGGFGDGIWEKKNGSWQVTLHYTSSDGSEATAINIYSNINNHSYQYSSINRYLDGEPIDNIEPVTVKKE